MLPGVCVCVYAEGGSSIYECLWLVSFSFFLSLQTTALQHKEEGGREGERENVWDDGAAKTWWGSYTDRK